MEPMLFTTINNTAYTAPTEPTRGTLGQRHTQEALKQQVQEVVDSIYLQQIKNKNTEFMRSLSKTCWNTCWVGMEESLQKILRSAMNNSKRGQHIGTHQ
eukprot:4322483-Ditylum_brightwellii.AAC.1